MRVAVGKKSYFNKFHNRVDRLNKIERGQNINKYVFVHLLVQNPNSVI